ncbi:hypothetical protein RND71_010955 [Anisodus tanguticus]|uniref:RRP12 N-terminal HEAT domain-containing protein n=1 Tax=Anisodus tanguticus TaxID=243964 RepID=A0AAE1SKR4_9SOLA|nr:hypothetical protein RND71_010955 [Anisodus tanguticus]
MDSPDNNNNVFNDNSDICQQLLQRYTKSSAPQHHHLIAISAATCSINQSESLPLTPFSYFAATISTILTQNSLDPQALSALSSFLSIVLPLVHDISSDKVIEAIGVLVGVLEKDPLGTSTVRAFVKCLGILVGFCDKEDWESVEVGFETLVKFTIDKRPKPLESEGILGTSTVRAFAKCGNFGGVCDKEDWDVVKVGFKTLVKFSIDKRPKPLESEGGLGTSSVRAFAKCLGILVGFCDKEDLDSVKVGFGTLIKVSIDMRPKPLESEGSLGTSTARAFVKCLGILVGFCDKKDWESVEVGFETLVKFSIDKRPTVRKYNMTLARKLSAPKEISGSKDEHQEVLHSLNILKPIIPYLTVKDNEKVLAQLVELMSSQSSAFTRHIFDNIGAILDASSVEIILQDADNIIKALISYISSVESPADNVLFAATWAKSIIDKLHDGGISVWITYLPLVVGSISGLLTHSENMVLPASNILKELASNILKELINAHIDGKKFLTGKKQAVDDEALSSSEFEAVKAICLVFEMFFSPLLYSQTTIYWQSSLLCEVLDFCVKGIILKLADWVIASSGGAYDTKNEMVNKNKNVLASDNVSGELIAHQTEGENLDLALEFKRKSSYSKKSASKNIKALASCSEEWLQALVNVFFKSSPANYQQFKFDAIWTLPQEAIECLTSITDSSLTQRIFTSSMERAGITNDIGEYKKLGLHSADNEENNSTLLGEVAKRCIILELGSCFVEGSSEDLIKVLFGIAKDATHGAGHFEAYHILSRILEKHSWFRSSHVEQLMDLLASVKPPTDTKSLTSRFACYKALLIDAIQGNLDEENTHAFLILNEIILALKASTEEGRKTAYDALIGVCSSLRDSSSAKSNESYKKFVDMIIAYLSGASPHIKNGAVSALSVLVFSDANICLAVPDLVPSVLTLLQSKDVEVTKAVLGFVKVFVSSIQAKDLHNLLSDIVNGVLPWSSVSRHNFRSKVIVVMEILMRKCGVAAVKSVAAEKHKNFLKTVSENRHSKSSSKEDGTPETESTPSDSRQHKRKDRESSDSRKEKDSRGPHKRKKRNEEEKDSSNNFAKEGVMGGKTRNRDMKRKGSATLLINLISLQAAVMAGSRLKGENSVIANRKVIKHHRKRETTEANSRGASRLREI